jgi:hypothetical protein
MRRSRHQRNESHRLHTRARSPFLLVYEIHTLYLFSLQYYVHSHFGLRASYAPAAVAVLPAYKCSRVSQAIRLSLARLATVLSLVSYLGEQARMLGSGDRQAWNRRSSRFEAVLPRSSQKEKPGSSGSFKTSMSVPVRFLVKASRALLVAAVGSFLLLVLLRRSSSDDGATQAPNASNRAVTFIKNRWTSASTSSSNARPAEWAIKVAEAILPDARTSTAQWEQERLIDLAKVIECRANDNCTDKQKHVVISGVGRWKWSLDETFERPAFFPNGEAGKPGL